MTRPPDPWLLSTWYYPTTFFQIRQGPCRCKYHPIALFSSIILFLSSTIGADPVNPTGVASTCRFCDLKVDKNWALFSESSYKQYGSNHVKYLGCWWNVNYLWRSFVASEAALRRDFWKQRPVIFVAFRLQVLREFTSSLGSEICHMDLIKLISA